MTRAVDDEIDRETAADLIEPLTELVVRAGAAILAVDRGNMAVERQGRRIAGDGGRHGGRPCHRRRPGAADPGSAGAVRGTQPPGQAALHDELLPDRSARRHQGVRRRAQRIHRQSRAGDAMACPCWASSARRRWDWSGAGWSGAAPNGCRSPALHPSARPSRSVPARSRAAAIPGSRPSAAPMATAGPRLSSTAGPMRCGRSPARRSNSAGWPRAAPTSIRGLRRPASGMSPRDMRW